MRAFRARALATGVAQRRAWRSAACSCVRSEDARDLYDGLTSGGGLVCAIGSGLFGLATLALVRAERYGPARFTAAAAVGAMTVGWALAQSPYFLPPELTLDEAAASDATLAAVLDRHRDRRGRPRPLAGVPVPPRAARHARSAVRAPRPALRPAAMKPLALMLGSFAAGLVLMVAFEHRVTRVLGVLALFAFIVTGVFLIADPELLGQGGRRSGVICGRRLATAPAV